MRHIVPAEATVDPGAVVGWIYAAGEEIPDVLPGADCGGGSKRCSSCGRASSRGSGSAGGSLSTCRGRRTRSRLTGGAEAREGARR